MFRILFLTAFRNLIRHKGILSIKLIGLVIGLTVFILVNLWVLSELSFNKFHKNGADIYHLHTIVDNESGGMELPASSVQYAPVLIERVKEIKNVCRVRDNFGLTLKHNNDFLSENNILFVDTSFFSMFNFPLKIGSKELLKQPKTLIISQKMADKYFKDQNAIGENIIINNNYTFTIGGIAENAPPNSDITFDFIAPLESLADINVNLGGYGSISLLTFVQLYPNIAHKNAEQIISQTLAERNKEVGSNIQGAKIIPLNDIHLKGNFSIGDFLYVKVFFLVSLLILIIASINYTNLSVAQSTIRHIEFGIKKVNGAGTKQITLQFIVEALMLIIIATIISIGLVYLIIPYFESFFNYTLSLHYIGISNIVTLLIITLVFTTLIAGLYPAILFSRHKAIQVLNKSFTGLKSGSVFRQSLTIFQFTVSIVLIASTFLIKNQLNYMLNKDLGAKKDNIMYLFFGDEIRDKMNSFSLEMNKISGVNSTCMTSQLPINVGALAGGLDWEGRKPNTERVFPYLAASYGLQQTYGIEVVQGRMFNNSEADINNYILNEEAIRIMQLENPIGKKFNMWGVNGRIVGVAKNFHHESLNRKIRPLLIANRPDLFNMVSLNFEGANIAETLKEVKKVWDEMCVGTPFDSHFVDDNFQNQYESYNRLKTMFTLLSIITIIISCIGLLGLTSFALQLRTKEIGVRRVNGANIIEMLKLLNGSFLKWVIVSCNLAIPVTYFVLNLWLQNFAYKVGIDWSIFLFAGIITLLIAFFTISIHTYKAATRNPIEALRYE